MKPFPEGKFSKANKDSLNLGALDGNKNRLPPAYTAHVDDNIFAEVAQYLPRSVAASVVSVDDVFGGSHEYQEDVLSDEKLNLTYEERRILLGLFPNSRTMMVLVSPRRREKTIKYIEYEGWTTTKLKATIRDIARILGLLQSICDIFIWGQAQLLILQQLLAEAIRKGYKAANRCKRLGQLYQNEASQVPDGLRFRLKYLEETMKVRFLWQCQALIHIPSSVRAAIGVIYNYLKSGKPWQSPIGHLIPRDPAGESKGDASHCAIGVVNEKLKCFLLLPYSKELFLRIKNEEVHINVLELLALFLGYVMFLTRYKLSPDSFPPFPQLVLWGDSMSANKWFRKFSTNSAMATMALRYFAEYMPNSPVQPVPQWIAGELNVEADDVSRVQELFSPKLKFIYNVSYSKLIHQVLQKYSTMRTWDLFLPSPELLSDLSCVVSSVPSMAVPSRKQRLGHFVPVERTFFGSAVNTGSSPSCFL